MEILSASTERRCPTNFAEEHGIQGLAVAGVEGLSANYGDHPHRPAAQATARRSRSLLLDNTGYLAPLAENPGLGSRRRDHRHVRRGAPLVNRGQRGLSAPGDFANIKVDVDSVLRLTIPNEQASTSEFAVYGPRGASHFANDPATKLALFEATGTTRQAVDQTTVYLSQTEDGSKKPAEQMGAAFETSGGLTPTAAPANVPNAKCWTKDTPQGVGTKCLVQHGQYVGEITAMDDEKKAHQLTAAQYLILTSPK